MIRIPHLSEDNVPMLRISLTGVEKQAPTLQQFFAFWAGINALYGLVRVAVDKKYFGLATDARYVSSGKQPDPEDQLYVETMHLGSPLDAHLILVLTGAAATAAFTVMQTLEKVYHLRVNRRKTEAETNKLNAEAEKIRIENWENLRRLALEAQDEETIAKHLVASGVDDRIRGVVRGLQESPLQIESVDVEIISPTAAAKAKEV
jgi:hypothetical protein